MLAILFEDAHCLAVAKPAGLLTQGRPAGEPTLEDQVRLYLNPGDPTAVYLGTVHRLDRPVSGVVLWAKTPKAARRLAEQFASREAIKEYWSIVEGSPPIERGTWEDWLCLDDTGMGVVQVCSPETPRARRALTRFEVGRARRLPEGNTWLVLRPETGRTHQLRVQAATRGLPIRGDRAYGASGPFPEGIALHARSLTVRHPILQKTLTFTAPLPGSWAGIELADDDSPQRHREHRG
jgi:23S rRNA pseudouridine1911/1915/1917 synthase